MKFIVGEVLKDPDARDLTACQDMVTACFASEDYVQGRTAFMENATRHSRGASAGT